MKRLILISCLVLGFVLSNAQKIYFVYLQTETGEPFFVRINDKLYSSTASGYLILPRLLDSTYALKLGFPGKNFDLDFSTSINKKDHGYLIKNFGDKGWGLFDLQSLSIQMSTSNVKSAAEINNSSNTPINGFTDLLSKAADDPSLKQNVVLVKEEEKKPEAVQTLQTEEKKPDLTEAVVKEEKKSEMPVQPANKTDEKTVGQANTSAQKIDSAAKDMTMKTEEYKKSHVTKISALATTEGFESVFVDQYQNGIRDTVRILIPAGNKEAAVKEEPKADSTKNTRKFLELSVDTTHVINRPSEAKKEDSRKWWPFGKGRDSETAKHEEKVKKQGFKKTDLDTKNNIADTRSSKSEIKKEETKKWSLFNNKNKNSLAAKRCKTIASNDDFLKLRRRMAGKTNDDGMLQEAKKYFQEKCFTTEQIKNLSSMFLSNAGKYNFFDAAHTYVSDKENFSSLQAELKDEYYANRFKALLGN